MSYHRPQVSGSPSPAVLLYFSISHVLPALCQRARVGDIPFPVERWYFDGAYIPFGQPDSRGAIRCIGGRPDEEIMDMEGLPSIRHLNSLLEFCAEPSYGGKLKNYWPDVQDDGASCAWWMSPERIIFSRRPTLRPEDHHWRRWQVCQIKCTCINEQIQDWTTAPLIDQSSRSLSIVPFAPRNIDSVHNTWGRSNRDHQADINTESTMVNHPIPMYYSVRPLGLSLFPIPYLIKKVIMNGIEENRLDCGSNPIPPWLNNLNLVFPNLISLCGMNLIFGHPDANAGMICNDPEINSVGHYPQFAHPFFDLSERTSSSFWFPFHSELSDDDDEYEYPRRVSAVIAIVSYCQVHCRCKTPATPTGLGGPRPHMFSNKTPYGDARLKNNGKDWVISKPASGGLPDFTWTLISQSTPQPVGSDIFLSQGGVPNDASSACKEGPDGVVWCVNPAPDNWEPSPTPTAAPFKKKVQPQQVKVGLALPARPRYPPRTRGQESTVCGASCVSASDCSSGGRSNCRCVVGPGRASLATIGRLNSWQKGMENDNDDMDPGRFTASCRSTAWLEASYMPLERLTGRHLNSANTGRAVCACNSTYISEACCGAHAGTGLVWE